MRNDDQAEREVRIALVLYGGVSLAIYENGVARCFHELVLGRGVFRVVLRLLRAHANVDVIAGTSAGGINGLILAACLESGTDFASTAALWRNLGDFGRLLHKTADADHAESLLDGEGYYHQQLRAAFADLCRPVKGWQSPGEIDLFITGTDLDGHARKYQDSLGAQISDKEHRLLFHLKHRPGRASLGIRKKTDPGDIERQASILAAVARITSSFPLAFPPFRTAQLDQHESEVTEALQFLCEVGGMRNRALVDGGVLDNKPFGPVMKAIFYRMPSMPVVRRLFYVEPDPDPFKDELDDQAGPATSASHSPVQVAAASLSTIPAHEGIAADLESLIQHNQRIRWLGELEQRVMESISGADRGPDAERALAAGAERALYRQTRIESLARLLVLDTDAAPSAHDYPKEARLAALLDAFQKTLRKALASQPTVALLDQFDAGLQQRLTFHMLYALYRAVDRDGRDDLGPAMRYCGRIIKAVEVIFSGMIALRTSILPEALENGPTEQTAWKIIDAFCRFLAADAPHWKGLAEELRGATLEAPDNDAARDLAGPALLTESLEAARAAANAIRFADLTDAPDVWHPTVLGCAFDALRRLGEKHGGSEFRVERWIMLDRNLYPLEFTSGIHERDAIPFARISPADAQIGLSKRSAKEKVAGDELAHFSSFLRRDWRSNDLLYGRLDGICQIVRSLLDDEELERAARRAVAEAKRGASVTPFTVEELGDLLPDCPESEREALEASWKELVRVTAAIRQALDGGPGGGTERPSRRDDADWQRAAHEFREALILAGQHDALQSEIPALLTDHYFQEIAYGRQQGPGGSRAGSSDLAIEGDANALALRDLTDLKAGERRRKFESLGLGSQAITGASGTVPNDVVGEYASAAYLLFWGLLERSVGNGGILGLSRARLLFRTPVLFFHHLFASLRRDRKTALISVLLGVGVVLGLAWGAWQHRDWVLLAGAVAVALVGFRLFTPDAARRPALAAFVAIALTAGAAWVGSDAASCLGAPPGDDKCAAFLERGAVSDPMLKLEFARGPKQIEAAVGAVGDPRRAAAKRMLWADFPFIAAYSLLFVTVALLLMRTAGGPRRALIGTAIFLVAVTAGADVVENFRILAALAPGGPADVAPAARLKWGSMFVALALLCTGFLGRGRAFLAVAVVGWAAAAVGLCGLVLDAQSLVQVAFVVTGLLAIALTIVLLVAPPVVARPPSREQRASALER